jgi:hypothetical protein
MQCATYSSSQNKKEWLTIVGYAQSVAENALTHCLLAIQRRVSVPAKGGSKQSATLSHFPQTTK